jgi:hypothetical protein
MDEQQARDEIRLIREMLERTRQATAESGAQFIFWGVWIILALIGNYVLVALRRFDWIWGNWAFFGLTGWAVTIIYNIRINRARRAKTYAGTATAYLCIACGIAFFMAAFAFPLLRVYSYGVISIIVALISGIMLFALGGIYQWPLLAAAGVLWWAGAAAMALIAADWRGIVLIPLLILGDIVPGLIFRARFRRSGGDKAVS